MATLTASSAAPRAWLDELNIAQRAAAMYGSAADGTCASGPLLIIAGAGTGKTNTLAHRVAHIVLSGIAPERILLLTFSRRASQEMIRRARRILAKAFSGKEDGEEAPGVARLTWAGTFHSVANRLVRRYAAQVGLTPASASWTAAIQQIFWISRGRILRSLPRSVASRAKTRASRSIRIASTRASRSNARLPRSTRSARSGTMS